jgi:hypothetical protein
VDTVRGTLFPLPYTPVDMALAMVTLYTGTYIYLHDSDLLYRPTCNPMPLLGCNTGHTAPIQKLYLQVQFLTAVLMNLPQYTNTVVDHTGFILNEKF